MNDSRHPHDLAPDLLAQALAAAERPDLLQKLVDTSRRIWGVYTRNISYTINYPWVAVKLESLPKDSKVLDIGAGATPLPLFLAERGLLVQTVDPHPLVRKMTATPDWTEWGFFDYSQLHPNLKSSHCTIADFTTTERFDAIYSVSVLAHMPRPVREDTLRRCRDLLRPGGLLLLAIDLIPATNFLWNFSSGREVEPPEIHGTIYDVIEQLSSLDFEIVEKEGRRGVAGARTDLAFIAGTRR
jgi:SAM-dependent methyltransferase